MTSFKDPTNTTLTLLESRLIEEYFVDLNQTNAYARATGKTFKSSTSIVAQIFKRPHVKAAIKTKVEDYKRMLGITHESILREYARIAFANPRNFFDETGNVKAISAIKDDDLACMQGLDITFERGEGTYTKKVRFHDKVRALDTLMKYMKMAGPVQLEVSGPDGGPIESSVRVEVYIPHNAREDNLKPVEGEVIENEPDLTDAEILALSDKSEPVPEEDDSEGLA